MHYTVYKVTNKVTGKVYIGTHKTNNLDDGYMGSGKYLRRSIEKHGEDNFTKEILYVFDNPDDMFRKEAELVNEDFLAEENTYNLKVGGFGGWDYVNSNITDEQLHRRAKSGRIAADITLKKRHGKNWRRLANGENHMKKMSVKAHSVLREKYPNGTWVGKKHTEETKKKMSESRKGKYTGEKSSQYGTMWIYSPEFKTNKKISKNDTIPDGWIKGRKIKGSRSGTSQIS